MDAPPGFGLVVVAMMSPLRAGNSLLMSGSGSSRGFQLSRVAQFQRFRSVVAQNVAFGTCGDPLCLVIDGSASLKIRAEARFACDLEHPAVEASLSRAN